MTKNKKIRIGCGQGFWGDWLKGPKNLVDSGNLNYLILDYLAEVTMSVLAKQKEKDQNLGYAKDFPETLLEIADHIYNKNLKIISNSGGLNPLACAELCLKKLTSTFPDRTIPKIAIVVGDDLYPGINDLISKGLEFPHLENKAPISEIKDSLMSANAYIGCSSVVEALEAGADIVITGRIADPSMCLAALKYEFSWQDEDWDKLASGIVAGHIIECGAQSTGGNFSLGWEQIRDPWNIGYPIVECSSDGSFVVTKNSNSGGLVSVATVTEQLIYEISDPENYITPDVIVDFTSLSLEQLEQNKVSVKNAKGKKAPEKLKISATFSSGFKSESTLVLVGPKVLKKSEICREMLEKRFLDLGLTFDEILFENLGAFSCIPGMEEKGLYPEPGEIVFRVAVRDKDKNKVKKFTREVAPLVLAGPSGITAYANGKGDIKEVVSFWPTLIDRSFVNTSWRFI
jgi:hypothetical protein